ncbi:Sensor histidine kinase YehU [compost metagenome]
MQSLSTFFRKNLKRSGDEVSLADELEHVNAYLQIELARFADRLEVVVSLPQDLLAVRLPAFSLQPIVENAIKHGTSQLLGVGRIDIGARREGECLLLQVTDNAGLFQSQPNNSGLGMNLVDKRIRVRYGDDYGVQVACEPQTFTRITINVPLARAA